MVLGVSILRAATGAACSPPNYSYAVGEVGPREVAPVNTPLLVKFEERYPDWALEIDQQLEPTLELRVDGSDTVEVLKSVHLNWEPGVLSFVPNGALLPNTKYTASVNLVNASTEPSQLLGKEKASWEFTTSDETREKVKLEGEFRVTFEAGLDDELDCEDGFGNCWSGCVPTGKKLAVTKARITLPAASGGFSEEFLSGMVTVGQKDGDGMLFRTTLKLEPGKAGELLITMPLLDGATYAPCFELTATDARDDHATTIHCLGDEFPAPSGEPKPDPKPEPKPDPKPEPKPDPELEPDPGFGDDTGERNSSSCSTSGGSHGAGSALLVALGLAALSRRRRQGSK